jgi:tetratricopeptide (TPR) repeat protein
MKEEKQMSMELLAKAQQDDTDAMPNVGIDYRNKGIGYRDQGNFEKAKHWLEKAYDKGDPGGAVELGILYQHGQGNLDQAIFWWEKVANGSADACRIAARNLVLVCDRGPHDRDRFLKWLEVLAKTHKDPWGMAVLGALYCGVEHKYWKDADFSPLPPEDRAGGFKLIEAGMDLAKKAGSDEDFLHFDYSALAQAYSKRPGQPGMVGCTDEELRIALKYQERARDKIKARAEETQHPVALQLLEIYEKQIENINGFLKTR